MDEVHSDSYLTPILAIITFYSANSECVKNHTPA